MHSKSQLNRCVALIGILLFSIPTIAQEDRSCHCPSSTRIGGHAVYGSFGFHRVFFTRSDIHMHDNTTANYDFVLHKVKARDDNDFNVGKGIDAPQYSVRIGIVLNAKKGTGFEISYDHAKYIAVQNQKVRITGQINGKKVDGDTVLIPDFVEYEHTDGANYYMLNFVKRKPIWHSANEKQWLSYVLKPGAGIVLPRSDTRIMGFHRNDKYHLAGYIVGLDGGLRYDFHKYFYAETTAKVAYANYRDVLLWGDGRARQHWCSLQAIFIVGFQLPL